MKKGQTIGIWFSWVSMCAQRTITLWMPFIGFIYPVVTHWAWSSGGWLTVGDSYAALNNEVVAYQVFKHPCIDKNFNWTSYCGNTQFTICRKVNWGLSVNPYDEPTVYTNNVFFSWFNIFLSMYNLVYESSHPSAKWKRIFHVKRQSLIIPRLQREQLLLYQASISSGWTCSM